MKILKKSRLLKWEVEREFIDLELEEGRKSFRGGIPEQCGVGMVCSRYGQENRVTTAMTREGTVMLLERLSRSNLNITYSRLRNQQIDHRGAHRLKKRAGKGTKSWRLGEKG